jgi:hypothetical protein
MSTVPAHLVKTVRAHQPDSYNSPAQTMCNLSEPRHRRCRYFPVGAYKLPPPTASRCPRAVSSTPKASPSCSPLFLPASFLCSLCVCGQPPLIGLCHCAVSARAAAPWVPPPPSSPRLALLSSKQRRRMVLPELRHRRQGPPRRQPAPVLLRPRLRHPEHRPGAGCLPAQTPSGQRPPATPSTSIPSDRPPTAIEQLPR